MRPLGAIVFGHVGDRLGRRQMMFLSVAIMTVTMLGTALLPTYARVGAAAGWLLFLLRCVMGFSVGGEYSVVVAYLLEGAPSNRRGLITSLASAASEIGGLFAVGVSLWFAAVRGVDESGWVIVLFGVLLAVFWTGFLRVGSQISLVLAPIATVLLIAAWLAMPVA